MIKFCDDFCIIFRIGGELKAENYFKAPVEENQAPVEEDHATNKKIEHEYVKLSTCTHPTARPG